MTERTTRAVPVLIVAAALTMVAMNWMPATRVQGQAQRASRTIAKFSILTNRIPQSANPRTTSSVAKRSRSATGFARRRASDQRV